MTKKVQLLTADSKQEVLHPETTADMVLVAVDQNLMEKLATLLPLAGGIMTGSVTFPNSTSGQIKHQLADRTPTNTLYITTGDNLRVGSADVNRTVLFGKNHPQATVGGTTYTLYSTGNKPTANDVGALPVTGGTVTGDVIINGALEAQGRLITNEALYVTNGTDGAFAAKLGSNGVDLGDTNKSTAICSSETPKYWDGQARYNIHNDKDNPISQNPEANTLVQRNANGEILGKNALIEGGEIWNGVARTIGIGFAHYSNSNDGYLRRLANGEMDLGHANYPYRNIYATSGNINTSDIKLKKNINPILSSGAFRMMSEEGESQNNSSPSVEDYYNFVKELPLYTYDYKTTGTESRALHNVGFIAQDIADTVVGHEFVFKGEDGLYQYNMQGYVGVLAVALQNAIKEIEFLKEQQENKSRSVN